MLAIETYHKPVNSVYILKTHLRQYEISVYGYRPRQRLRIKWRFGKHCSYHLQAECMGFVRMQLTTYCMLYTRFPKTLRLHTFTLKMGTAVSAETRTILNIRRDMCPKAEVTHWIPAAKT
jgi:hypothetical protein